MHIWDWGLLALFTVSIVAVGLLKARTVHDETTYLLAGKRVSLFALTATLVMTELNTSTLLSFSAFGYSVGWWGLSLPFIFLISLSFYAFTVAKKWKQFNGVSVAHYFSLRFGKDVGLLAALILFAAMALFSATYVKSLTMLFSFLVPNLGQWVLSALLVLLVLAMTIRGGLVSIIWTDIISFMVICLFFPLLLLFTWMMPVQSETSLLDLPQMFESLPPQFVLSLVLLSMFSYILAPWYGQKVVAAKSSNVAMLAVLLSAVIVFVLYGVGVFATSILRQKGIDLANPELALPYIVQHALPVSMKGIAYGVLFCIAATTLSGVWSAMVTIIVGDVENTQFVGIKRSLVLTLICASVSFLLANVFVDQIFHNLILANIPIVALSFALLGGFYWQGTTRSGVYVSIIVGLICGIGTYLYYGDEGRYTLYWALYGIPLIFISGIATSLLTRNRKKLTLDSLDVATS